jgi:hypothetical protein
MKAAAKVKDTEAGYPTKMKADMKDMFKSPKATGILKATGAQESQKVVKVEQPKEENAEYERILAKAKLEDFHDMKDAHVLTDAGWDAKGQRILVFVPAYLRLVQDDELALERVFEYIVFTMDAIVNQEKAKYIFLYCHSGMNWLDPHLSHFLRHAYDTLPRRYAKNLSRFYMIHPTMGLKTTVFCAWPFLSRRLWEKIEYVPNLDELVEALYPDDVDSRKELKRHFPLLVHREDALFEGRTPPQVFGTPLEDLCSNFGVDVVDPTTGRHYHRLPPTLNLLCEVLERRAAEGSLHELFSHDAKDIYDLVADLDEGEPVSDDVPAGTVWGALKLFLDCLPVPLLSFQAYNEVQVRQLKPDDQSGHLAFLDEVLHHSIPPFAMICSLYVAGFLHRMLKHHHEHHKDKHKHGDHNPEEDYTEQVFAEVFAPCFFRPRTNPANDLAKNAAVCRAITETLIANCEQLWPEKPVGAPPW